MAKRSGLGKGLGALLPTDDIEEVIQEKAGVLAVPVDSIVPNHAQPRTEFDEEKIAELADSIKRYGVLQPIIVRKEGDGKYELIMGERRLRASKKAGLTEIPVIIKEATDRDMAELALIENLQRQDLSPLEEAAAFQNLIEEYNCTQESLGEIVGKSRSYIANSLRLLALNDKEKDAVAKGLITPGHARALLAIKTTEGRVFLLEEIITKELSVRQTEEAVKRINKTPTSPQPRPQDKEIIPDYIKQLEDKLRTKFGTKVTISKKKIEIDFYGDDDLNRVLSLLVDEEKSLI